MKRSELFFAAVLVPIDFIALILAGAAAHYLRTSQFIQAIRPATFVLDLPFAEYMQLVVVVAIAIVLIFSLQGLYAMRVTRRLHDELVKIFAGISAGIMGVIILIFLRAELFQSRFILLTAYVLAVLMVSVGRWLVRKVQLSLLNRGFGVYRVILVGNGHFASQLERTFQRQPRLGYKVVATPDTVNREELEKIYQQYGLDEVIKTDPTLTGQDNLVLLEFCDKHKIDYKYIPDLYETYAAHIRFRQIAGVPLMELMRTPLDGWGRVIKRMIDVMGSALGLILLSPLFLLVAALIKLDSAGPIIYSQIRVGKSMKQFMIYKFRSMKQSLCTGAKYGGSKADQYQTRLRHQQNERSGPLFKMKNDPRITSVGKWLRRTRIDELPQLFNVLKGEMSLIGPRPHLPSEIARYRKQHHKLFTIKPGMSGMSQVSGGAGLPFAQEAKLDIGYIEDWSLKTDIVILMKTLRLLFTDKNAV